MISFTHLTASPIDTSYLRRISEETLKRLTCKESAVNIVFVGERRMRALNRFYRGKNRVTDVLAFSYTQQKANSAKGHFIESPGQEELLGEIVLCLPRARKQARRRGHPLKKELAILVIHGILHLVGHEHERGGEGEREMLKLQEEIFNAFA